MLYETHCSYICCAPIAVIMGNARSFSGSPSDAVAVRRDKSRGERAIEEKKRLLLCGSSASFASLLVLDAVTSWYFAVPLP